MAAFSYQEQPNSNSFLLDSVLIPNKNVEEGNYNFINSTTCFPQLYPSTPLDHQYYYPLLVETPHPHVTGFHEPQFDDHSYKAATFSGNEPSVSTKQISPESSTVVDSNNKNNNNNKLESGGDGQQVTQKPKLGRKRKNSTNLNSAQSKDIKEEKPKKQKRCNNNGKKKEEEKKKKPKTDDEKKVAGQETTGYIHVRARRGQATDSHSLAERVRREKISERMKMLQRLVPGCDKVTGKALMLEEIINYVQSLQNQVEFLSMKLTSVNPLFYDFGMDLGALMVRQEMQSLSSSMASHLPSLQQCSPIHTTAFADATTTTTTVAATNTSYPVTDASSTPLFLQGQDGGLMWDASDEQRQKLVIPSGFAHNLCSFH